MGKGFESLINRFVNWGGFVGRQHSLEFVDDQGLLLFQRSSDGLNVGELEEGFFPRRFCGEKGRLKLGLTFFFLGNLEIKPTGFSSLLL